MHKGYPLELKQKIIIAFRNVKHPGRKKIGGGTLIDEEFQSFKQNRWDEITKNDMFFVGSMIHFFSPSGLHYYVQSYLIFMLMHPDSDEGRYVAMLLIEAFATYDERYEAQGVRLCDDFTRPQMDVIIEFLKYIPELFPTLFITPYKNNARAVAEVEAKKASWAKALAYWQACNG